jgi:hypothetical protein
VGVSDDDKKPIDQLVEGVADVFVFAPIGLFFEGPSMLPKLARQGRVHANNARLFGQFAVKHGEAEVRRRLGEVEQQAVGWLKLFGLVPDEGAAGRGADRTAAPTGSASGDGATEPAPVARMEAASGNGHTVLPPDAGALAIPDYDSLSASQVVTRLDGLGPDELEAIRAYEAAHRGRKTILNKVAQLEG